MKRTLRREWKSIWNCIKGISKEEVWGCVQSCVLLRRRVALGRGREDERFASTAKSRSGRYPLCGLITRAGAPCFGLCSIRLIGAARLHFCAFIAAWILLHFILDVAGLVALKLCGMRLRRASHASLNSFFYPVLKHGSRSLRLKRALWWVKPTDDAERNWSLRTSE